MLVVVDMNEWSHSEMSMDEDPLWYGRKFKHVSRSEFSSIQNKIKMLEEEIRELRNRIEVLERTYSEHFYSDNTNRRSS